MRKLITVMLILFSTIVSSVSDADVANLNEVDKPPRVTKVGRPFYPSAVKNPYGGIYYEGRVVLRFVVDETGRVQEPEIVESVPEGVFDESALNALKMYRFKPAKKDGKSVACIVRLPIQFSVPGAETSYDAYKESDKGLKYFRVGEYDNAINAFTEAIRIDEKYSPSYSGRGMVYGNQGKYKEAISDFSKAIQLNPENEIFYKLRGQVFTAMEDFPKAIEDYSKALKIKPDMLDSYFDRGEVSRKMGNYTEAISDYTRVIELDESYVQAYNNRAVCYNKLKDTSNMCLDLKKACDLDDCRGYDYAKKAGKCSDDLAVSNMKQ